MVGILKTSWGFVGVAATEKGIVRVVLPKASRKAVEQELAGFINPSPPTAQRWAKLALKELSAYLRGKRASFSVPLDLGRLPPSIRKILRAAQKIPVGQTVSYHYLAERVGNPKAARLVGQAMAKNPVPLLIPCHRVIRSDGSLGGYGGGLKLKAKLLEFERQTSPKRK